MHERSIEEPILQVKNLKKYFPMGKNQILKAVDDVSFEIQAGKTLGLVGESGCGKTTCGRTCTGLYAKTDGEVLFKGKDVHALRGKERKAFTKSVQTIFQDPYASLNPRMKVGSIIAEGLRIHHMLGSKSEREEKVQELLNIFMSFQVDSAKESESLERLQLSRNFLYVMNRFPRWMCQFKLK